MTWNEPDPARRFMWAIQALALDATEQLQLFPEFEALLTYAGSGDGAFVQQAVADARAITLRQQLSFVRLPDNGFRKRAFHPASGGWSVGGFDFAQPLSRDLDVRWQARFRLQKTDPANTGTLILRARVAIRHAAIAMNSRQELDSATELLAQASRYIAAIPPDTRVAKLLTAQHEMESAILGNWKGAYTESQAHARKGIAVAESLTPDPIDARETQYVLARLYDALAESVYYGVSVPESEPVLLQLWRFCGA